MRGIPIIDDQGISGVDIDSPFIIKTAGDFTSNRRYHSYPLGRFTEKLLSCVVLQPMRRIFNISDLIQKMANEFYSKNPYKEQTIEYLMQILFVKTKEQMETKGFQPWHSKIHDELIELRSEIYSNPQNNWSIPLLAERLHISCGYLQNIYKNTFFISCMSDVIESRITYAKELLIESDLPVGEISRLCGYQNDVHFMRQFKKLTTLTPTEYRRLNSVSDK